MPGWGTAIGAGVGFVGGLVADGDGTNPHRVAREQLQAALQSGAISQSQFNDRMRLLQYGGGNPAAALRNLPGTNGNGGDIIRANTGQNAGGGGASGLPGGMDRANNGFLPVDPNGRLTQAGDLADSLLQAGRNGYLRTGERMEEVEDRLGRQMRGEDSISAEQLRQNLGQVQAAQQSFAAGQRPNMQAMAARTAMTNMGRAQTGLAGQQALAGIQERTAAGGLLGQYLNSRRQQDLEATNVGLRGSIDAFGQIERERTARWNGLLGNPTDTERNMGFLRDALTYAPQIYNGIRNGGQPAPAQAPAGTPPAGGSTSVAMPNVSDQRWDRGGGSW